MITNIDFTKLPTHILKRAIKFKEKMERLERGMKELIKEALIGGDEDAEPGTKFGKRKVSAATKRKMAEAAKLRWAKKGGTVKVKKARKKMSAATKAKMRSAAKARWAVAKKAGKNTL